MFKRLKNAFLGRTETRMSKKRLDEIISFARNEFKHDPDYAVYMITTGQFNKLQGMQK